MPIFFMHPHPFRNHQSEDHALIKLQTAYNTYEGSEFLDDAIRNEDDQSRTEEDDTTISEI